MKSGFEGSGSVGGDEPRGVPEAGAGSDGGQRQSEAVGGGRWHHQTLAGGGHLPLEERGNCVPACITSILGMPLDAIANTHGEGWWDRLQAEVGRHGYCIAIIDLKLEPPPGLWIASLPSRNLPIDPDGKVPWHSIVCRGFEFVHDPSIARRYNQARVDEAWEMGWIAEGWALMPIDPVELVASSTALTSAVPSTAGHRTLSTLPPPQSPTPR